MNHCPSNNPGCTIAKRCATCATSIVADGQRVSVPMILMDSVQQQLAGGEGAQVLDAYLADAVAGNARAGQAAIDAAKRASAGLQGAVDHAMRQMALRDHHRTRNGYDLSLQGFDRLGPSRG